MIICPYCGTENELDAEVCINCTAKLEIEGNPKAKENERNSEGKGNSPKAEKSVSDEALETEEAQQDVNLEIPEPSQEEVGDLAPDMGEEAPETTYSVPESDVLANTAEGVTPTKHELESEIVNGLQEEAPEPEAPELEEVFVSNQEVEEAVDKPEFEVEPNLAPDEKPSDLDMQADEVSDESDQSEKPSDFEGLPEDADEGYEVPEVKEESQSAFDRLDAILKSSPSSSAPSAPSPPSAVERPAGSPEPIPQVPPDYPVENSVKDKTVAFVLEVLPALIGFLGIGWLYAGITTAGIITLIGFLGWNVVAVILDVVTLGIFLCVHIPLNILIIALSVFLLNQHMRKYPEIFN